MKITREEDYALTFLAALGANFNRGYLSLEEIAEKNSLPLPFLKKIARSLKAAGLLLVKEGKNGGYTLAEKPQNLTVGKIISIYNPKPTLTNCIKGRMISCPRLASCQTRTAWDKVSKMLYENLDRIKLSDFSKNSF